MKNPTRLMSAWEELICVCIAHPGCATSDHHTSTNGLTVHHHGRDLPVTKLGWIQWWLAQHGEPKFPSCLAVITPTFLGIKTPSCFMVLGSKGIYIYIFNYILKYLTLLYTVNTREQNGLERRSYPQPFKVVPLSRCLSLHLPSYAAMPSLEISA